MVAILMSFISLFCFIADITWSHYCNLGTYFYYHSSIVMKDSLYLLGGTDYRDALEINVATATGTKKIAFRLASKIYVGCAVKISEHVVMTISGKFVNPKLMHRYNMITGTVVKSYTVTYNDLKQEWFLKLYFRILI